MSCLVACKELVCFITDLSLFHNRLVFVSNSTGLQLYTCIVLQMGRNSIEDIQMSVLKQLCKYMCAHFPIVMFYIYNRFVVS